MKCICQVCACGKHRCPHFVVGRKSSGGATNKDPCKVVTEYRGEFKKGRGPEPIKLHKPSDCIKSEGNVDFDTTHQRTYPAHPIELSPRKKKAAVKVEVRTTPMDGETEYGKNYKKGETVQPPSPPAFIKKKTSVYACDEGPVEVSVTQKDYDVKQAEIPVVIRLHDNHVPSNAPFEAKSVNHTDYTKFNERPRPSGRQPDKISTKGQPGYFDTTSRSHYVKHDQREPVQLKGPKEVYVPNVEPFEGSSLMKADYGAHDPRIKSSPRVKHDNKLFASNEPMRKLTTNSAMYQSWGVPKPPTIKEPAKYRPPSKDMDMQKTSDDYKHHGFTQHAKSLRPKTNIVCGGDFECTTENSERFIKHAIAPPSKPIVHEREYKASSVPFQGCTENKDHYKAHQSASPAKMVRRVNGVFERNAAFDAHTSYKVDYASKRLPVCPITRGISTNFDGYRMIEMGGGHRCLQRENTDSNCNSFVGVSPLPPINDSKAASLVTVH